MRTETGTKRAVVVGSGLAGLSAGYRLHQFGWQVKVLESLDRVGGRVWSESENGFLFDVGPTIVTHNYTRWAYAANEADVGYYTALYKFLSNYPADAPVQLAGDYMAL